MTVVATLMAGLSSSEMTRAQYDRSLAAQQQSKVGDQWSFFQAKRLRGATLRASLQLLQATTDISPLDGNTLRQVAGTTVSEPSLAATIGFLLSGDLPASPAQSVTPPAIKSCLEAIAAGQTETEVSALLADLSLAAVDTAILTAQEETRAFEKTVSPTTQLIDGLEKQIMAGLATTRETIRPLARNFTAARMRYDAARYDAEARYNRTIAELYELKVRLSNISAERHHLRSQRFFFGMLGAQAAVILASFALAVQRRNLLWGFAAGLGLTAAGFGAYVYMYV